MTDRAAAPTERATACPFVAFEDDRDERSDRPDHRHRCFAEARPAPRAIAHQEAFCLSPAFAGCPTFQDWARREAAHTSTVRSASTATPAEPVDAAAAAAAVGATADHLDVVDDGIDDESDYGRAPAADERARSSSRDWAAPPPWAVAASASGDSSGLSGSSSGSASSGTAAKAAAGAGAGLAASRWLADGSSDADDAADAEAGTGGAAGHDPGGASAVAGPAPDPELAGLVGRSRPARSRARTTSKATAGQATAAQAKAGRRPSTADDGGPSWERPRRFEAYPTLRTRVGFPAVPRIILGLAGLALAAFIVFMVPSLFFSSGDQGTGGLGSPTPSAVPSASVAATPIPAATPLTYTVKAGDNLGKIAKKFGLTQKEILAANPKIKNANLISVGQVIIIPAAASPTEVIDSGPTSPSPAASSAAP
ncbi:MAG: LysM peptidoglycan-binding domain-containing protein [Candidatus Limnocylindrales bacterium]